MQNKTEMIWEKFSHQLKAYIRRRVSDAFLADDILQEVFLKIHSKIDTLGDDSKMRSWLYRITQNTITDYYRKHKVRLEDIDTQELAEEMPEESPVREIASGLRSMVEALPDKYSEALLLVEFEGLSQTELAKKLGISVSGAKSRVQRGREMIRDSLMRCCHFEFDRHGTIIDFHPVTCCCCRASG